MSRLEFGPENFFATVYNIVRSGTPLGKIECSSIREQATITIDRATYFASGEGIVRGTFHLEANCGRVATAEKPSVFRRLFIVQVGPKSYTLKAVSTFSRAFVLVEGESQIGFIAPNGFFSGKSAANLPDNLAPEIKTFLIWLVIIDRRRDGFGFRISLPRSPRRHLDRQA
ncbi:MAG TPA: hypothetical protein VGJ20_42445 [Xanthobacteraceae bacterium]|jgi:hypothetical protein